MARTHDSPGFVYLFRLGEFVKIGSSANPPKRLADYFRLPYRTEILHCINSARAGRVECALHVRFRHERVGYEWFRLSAEQIARLKQLDRVDCPADLPDDLRPLPLEPVSVKRDLMRMVKEICRHIKERDGVIVTPSVLIEQLIRPVLELHYQQMGARWLAAGHLDD